MKCPECSEDMEYHPTTCYRFYENITKGEHYFCSSCNIEAFPSGEWRRGR